jgi:hypothetical protein
MHLLVHGASKGRRHLMVVLILVISGLLMYGAFSSLSKAADSSQLTIFKQAPRRVAVPPVWRTVVRPTASVTFPLVASADRRYLQDQGGQPFPILGRTSWAIVSLGVSDYESYLDDTAAKGFNAIELWGIYADSNSNNRPYSGNGQLPFTKRLDGQAWTGSFSYSNINNEAPDLTQPNESYWAHLDGILNYAASKGVLCFLFPAYVGYGGSLDDGWMQIMVANGTTRMASYGAWVANRYKSYANIVWMLGGDMGTGSSTFSSSQLAAEQALLSGLKSVSAQQSTNFCAEWAGDSIYTTISDATLKAAGTLQGAYTWGSVSTWCRNGYATTPTMPTFLLEGPYGEEGHSEPTRRHQWWSWLSGIGGFMAGNAYVWIFNTTGWGSPPWYDHLNSQGTLDNARLAAFIKSVAWQTLIPSGLGGMKTLITAGGSTPGSTDYVAAAADPAGTLLVAYVPPAHSGTITVDMTAMSGPAQARWYNPTTAAYTLISSSIANTGPYTFTPPGNNGTGYDDWVLVLYAAAPRPFP